jgi:hypothetical protein
VAVDPTWVHHPHHLVECPPWVYLQRPADPQLLRLHRRPPLEIDDGGGDGGGGGGGEVVIVVFVVFAVFAGFAGFVGIAGIAGVAGVVVGVVVGIVVGIVATCLNWNNPHQIFGSKWILWWHRLRELVRPLPRHQCHQQHRLLRVVRVSSIPAMLQDERCWGLPAIGSQTMVLWQAWNRLGRRSFG